LKQNQFSPVPVEKQVAIIYAGSKGLLKNVPVEKVKEFEKEFVEFLELKHQDVLDSFKAGKLDKDKLAVVEKVCADLSAKY